MQVEAFAKINWSLDITGVREDGYHLMDMLMQPVSLSDEIRLSPAPVLSLSTDGFPRVRADRSNLAYRAAEALKQQTGYKGGAAIHVFKRIPVGAGLGGGSADAAGVLRGLNTLWGLRLTDAELEEIGLSLGADVPFCLRGGLTRTRGIGETLENLSVHANYRLVIVQPCRGLSTGEVFKAWTPESSEAHPDTDSAAAALEKGDLTLLCRSIGNVLQSVSVQFRPEIGSAITVLRQAGALCALMTGSGSAVFGVFQSAREAQLAFSICMKRWRSVFLCHTQSDSIRIQAE